MKLGSRHVDASDTSVSFPAGTNESASLPARVSSNEKLCSALSPGRRPGRATCIPAQKRSTSPAPGWKPSSWSSHARRGSFATPRRSGMPTESAASSQSTSSGAIFHADRSGWAKVPLIRSVAR